MIDEIVGLVTVGAIGLAYLRSDEQLRDSQTLHLPIIKCTVARKNQPAAVRRVSDNEYTLTARSARAARHELTHILRGHISESNLDERPLHKRLAYVPCEVVAIAGEFFDRVMYGARKGI
jgi:hypothetical protein